MHRYLVGALAVLVAACGPTAGDGPSGAFKYTGTTAQPVTGNLDGDLLAKISVTVGSRAHTFVVDTGAPSVLLDSTTFSDQSTGGHTDTALSAFGLSFTGVTSIVAPIVSSNPPGLIGGTLLTHFAYSIDYAGDRVWLSDPFKASDIPSNVAAGTETDVPFQILGAGTYLAYDGCTGASCHVVIPATRILVQATFEDATSPVWVMVDTGASDVLMDPAVLAALADDPNRPELEGAQLGTVYGQNSATITRVWRMKIQGPSGGDSVIADNIVAVVSPDNTFLANASANTGKPIKALLGGSFLRNFLTTVDYQKGMLRLQKYVDPMISIDEWTGPSFMLVQDPANGDNWLASSVFTNGDAAAQGMANGDVVTAIGDQSLTGQPLSVVLRAYQSYTDGESMPVTFTHSGTQHTINVLVKNQLPDYPPPS